jgi:hydroxymethylbilane synthase
MRLGTRGSALALAQSTLVADALAALTGEPVELVEITTAGDRSHQPIPTLGVGVFVSALRDALLAKEIDFAVHSYKDLPTAPADGLCLAAVPTRDDPRDALITRDGSLLAELGRGAVVGTGAVRRIAQLGALGAGLECRPVRGNVDTRLRKLADGEYDALVLAAAGLRRLGRAGEITEVLDPMLMLPAPAQGALAVECREDAVSAGGTDLVELLGRLDDAYSRCAVVAERTLLATLEAGCSAPVAALADLAEDEDGRWELYLRGGVFSPGGDHALRLSRTAQLPPSPSAWPAAAEEIGNLLAADLLAQGAQDVLGVHE